jgi:septum formation protein
VSARASNPSIDRPAPEVVLASASPRRSVLLRQIGVVHRVVPADIDESRRPRESARDCVQRLALAKAQDVQVGPEAVVLGADTAVVLGEEMLGKPRDRADALAMLARLSGRSHRVLSAVAVVAGADTAVALSVSEVRFRALTEAECAAYWDSGEPRDKAGAYAIQGWGAVFIAELRGSYSGVMGLPLFETAQLLRAAGVTIGTSPLPDAVP